MKLFLTMPLSASQRKLRQRASIWARYEECAGAARSAGDVNQLGASFLKRLASVESRNGELILRR